MSYVSSSSASWNHVPEPVTDVMSTDCSVSPVSTSLNVKSLELHILVVSSLVDLVRIPVCGASLTALMV